MSTAFDDMLRDLVEPNVDRIFAEDFILTPWLPSSNGRGGQDPERAVILGKGVLNNPTATIGIQMGVRKTYREANDLRAITMGAEPYLSVDLRQFEDHFNEPHQGDRVMFPGRPNLPAYDVAAVERDGLTRLKMKLVERGGT